MTKPITVTGYYGEAWLEKLYPNNVGPSPAAYTFDTAELVQELDNGKVLVRVSSPDHDHRWPYHPDGSRCNSNHCPHGKSIIWWAVFHKTHKIGIIPARKWKFGGRGNIPERKPMRLSYRDNYAGEVTLPINTEHV